MRLTSNPFFPYMNTRLMAWLPQAPQAVGSESGRQLAGVAVR
jgi:hypothetical protein